ncbi:MAG: sugar kinase [Chloroflexota bacterium]|nr:sugar kinase [Chloroflexota bacterium]
MSERPDGPPTTSPARPPGRVVAFGEAMVRLTPPGHERLERTPTLNLTAGGAELNAAATVACLGLPAAWVSVLPDVPLGRFVARGARAAGVDLADLRWVPEAEGRAGLYFLEEGTDPRPSAVHYDRAGSAFARLQPGAFDWPAILDGAAAFHLSGITPALGNGPRQETFNAVRAANAAGVPVAFDLNYRSKLWSESEARACFVELIPLVDVLFAGRGTLRTFFGLDGDHETVLRAARQRLGPAVVTLSRKKARASRALKLSTVAMGPSGEVVEAPWREVEVVDRLGGGDAFAGGFLAAYAADSADLPRAVALGSAAQALKHTLPGDLLAATRAEIEALSASTADEGGALHR